MGADALPGATDLEAHVAEEALVENGHEAPRKLRGDQRPRLRDCIGQRRVVVPFNRQHEKSGKSL